MALGLGLAVFLRRWTRGLGSAAGSLLFGLMIGVTLHVQPALSPVALSARRTSSRFLKLKGREKGSALNSTEARYMRVLPPASCWKYAGGRIINLHHGLLPGFPGFRPYHDAYNARMLTFGATCHFIIPDWGNRHIQVTGSNF